MTAKLFIFSLLFVIWAVPGWAGEPADSTCKWQRLDDGRLLCLLEAQPGHVPLETLLDAEEAPNPLACLATMEQAMRAMEPFIAPLGEVQAKWSIEWLYKPGETLESRSRKWYHGEFLRQQPLHERATKLWAEAKRCWKNEP